ncbi:MAG: SPFH/Band 7/PHB domain protein, partial [Chloroflexi bacterium]|nr:SPFH/Band 7/PHB domain protein [Chloroflexota bacterium]
VRIVNEYDRLVVFRLGRVGGQRGPGIVLLVPFVDRAVRVDLREQVREVPHQTSITADNAPISIDFLWYYRVQSAVDSVVKVSSFEQAAGGIATTTLRSVIGSIQLDNVLSEREHINQVLRTKLDETTESWGVKVTRVEIKDITPPRDVQDAMNRQLSAERTRRALVTESQGDRDAAINRAEGKKQAAVLEADGARQAAILAAEGARESQLLRAQGFADALEKINVVAATADQRTMALQYLETLKTLGESPSSKFIFPMEFTELAANVLGVRER